MSHNIEALHQQAQQALNNKSYQQAHQYLIAILKQDKYFADAYFLLAIIASAHHNADKAITLIKQALVLSSNNAEYLAQLAKQYALKSDHVNALACAQQAADAKPQNALTLDTIGVAYSQMGLHQDAVPFFEQAVSINDKEPNFFFNLGASLKFVGDFEQAKKAYQKAISIAPNCAKAHTALTSLGGITAVDNHIEELTELYQKQTTSDDLLYIGHALAREHEALGDYQQAYHYLSQSKEAKLKQLDYSFSQDQEVFTALHAMFTKPATSAKQGQQSNEAIFVVGMPRTGTTLVERIISQHQQVTSAGELPHFGVLLKSLSQCLSGRAIDQGTIRGAANIDFAELGRAYIDSTRAITGNTKFFVDKMPFNFLYIGFILQALPEAKIVCLDRNPLDTIVSNFRQLFTAKSELYNYAYDLETITALYIEFKRLAALWLQLFPENVYLVNYEKLVNNPEVEAKKLVKFCGLDWQASFLNIHENSAPVATASAVQVRQPINNKSVGNWKKYQHYLDGAQTLLRKSGIDY